MSNENDVMDHRVTRIETVLFGGPGQKPLRQDIVDYIDERDAHKENNSKEDIGLLRADMKYEVAAVRKDFSDKHEENKATKVVVEHIKNTLAEWKGVITAAKWGIPIMISLLTLLVAMIALVLHKS